MQLRESLRCPHTEDRETLKGLGSVARGVTVKTEKKEKR